MIEERHREDTRAMIGSSRSSLARASTMDNQLQSDWNMGQGVHQPGCESEISSIAAP